MSGGFVKLYQTILDSSVWGESLETRMVWITMLTMADAKGNVTAAVGGLARRARVSREATVDALEVLSSPDPDDRSGVLEGRRIVVVQGGWHVVNHGAYREKQTEKQRADAERKREYRERKKQESQQNPNTYPADASRTSVDVHGHPPESGRVATKAEAKAEAEADLPPVVPLGDKPKKRPRKRKPQVAIPDDWAPTEKHTKRAQELGLDLVREARKFRNNALAKDRRLASWNAGFNQWLDHALEFAQRDGRAPPDSAVQSDVPYHRELTA